MSLARLSSRVTRLPTLWTSTPVIKCQVFLRTALLQFFSSDSSSTSNNNGDDNSAKNKGRGGSLRPAFDPAHEEEGSSQPTGQKDDLAAPTNCCMSGCVNCVWIDYVERLTTVYAEPGLSRDRVHAEVESIEDGNIKAFLIMELRSRGLW